jgi:hypothetical protein
MPDKLDLLRLCLLERGLDPDRVALIRQSGQIPTRPFKTITTDGLLSDVFGAEEAQDMVLVEYTD